MTGDVATGPRAGAAGAAEAPGAPGALRIVLAALGAALCAAGIAALASFFVGSARGQRLDELILTGAQRSTGGATDAAEAAVASIGPALIGAMLIGSVVLALVRRRPGDLVLAAVLVGGANLTTQLLKHLVIQREALAQAIAITPNSFPSGHTTLAATSSLALVLCAGAARGPLAVVGALWTAAAGIGTLVEGWHRPSDVAGAVLVATAWSLALLTARDLRQRSRARAAGRRRSHAAAPTLGQPPGTRRLDVICAILLLLLGLLGVTIGVTVLSQVHLPLDLGDASQAELAQRAATALLGGGTAVCFGAVLLQTGPPARPDSAADRVP